jgi:acyl carrier protein
VSLALPEFLEVVRSVCPEISEEDLALPVRDTPLDSLDLLVFRSSLEGRLGRHLSDDQWLSANTLQALFDGLK